jgi:hypothetical protein
MEYDVMTMVAGVAMLLASLLVVVRRGRRPVVSDAASRRAERARRLRLDRTASERFP